MANFERSVTSTDPEGNSILELDGYNTKNGDEVVFLVAHETGNTPNSTTLCFTKDDVYRIREMLDDYLQWEEPTQG